MTPYRGTRQSHGTGSTTALRDRVAQVRAAHCEGTDGWCRGCAQDGALAFHPCPAAVWAAGSRGDR